MFSATAIKIALQFLRQFWREILIVGLFAALVFGHMSFKSQLLVKDNTISDQRTTIELKQQEVAGLTEKINMQNAAVLELQNRGKNLSSEIDALNKKLFAKPKTIYLKTPAPKTCSGAMDWMVDEATGGNDAQ